MRNSKEPKWRTKIREGGNWFKQWFTFTKIFTVTLAAAALLGSVLVTPDIGFTKEYFLSLSYAIGVLGIYSLIVFFIFRTISWSLIYISNFRPLFWFDPKIGNWFEVTEDNRLKLIIAAPKRTKNAIVEYHYKRLVKDGLDYILHNRHNLTLISPSRGGSLIFKDKISGMKPYEVIIGHPYKSGYALRLSDVFSTGYEDGQYTLLLIRGGIYRDWPFPGGQPSIQFTINGNNIKLDKVLEMNDKHSKQKKRNKKLKKALRKSGG